MVKSACRITCDPGHMIIKVSMSRKVHEGDLSRTNEKLALSLPPARPVETDVVSVDCLIPEAVTCSRGSEEGFDRPSPPTRHRRGSGKNTRVSESCTLWRNCALPCT